MAIIGIVASILTGFFVNNLRKAQLRDGAVQLLTELRQARSQAQRTSQNSTVTLTSTAYSSPNKGYSTAWGGSSAQSRTLTDPIRVAPYVGGTITTTTNSIIYSTPYGEVTGGAAVSGIVWEISSTVISDKLYVKAVGVTGKVILSATPN
ncbi:GspH/FimT family pseudopilin [Deinococcus radiomollis]|uniref:pilus assembly FimT family protein n=1 Tax=Deinococcus radiomollis TaxID=468916 RepID=UPI0038927BBE